MAHGRRKRMAGRRPSRRRFGGSFWGGLAIGLVIATGVYVYQHLRAASQAVAIEVARPTPAPAPEKPSSPPPKPDVTRSQFDFYTILPELEVVVPDPQVAAPERKPAESVDRAVPDKAPQQAVRVDAPGVYILQIGSFRERRDADRMKAELALLGVEAGIETVSVNQQKWHRVRVGPYRQLAQLNNARSELLANNIDFMLLKVRD